MIHDVQEASDHQKINHIFLFYKKLLKKDDKMRVKFFKNIPIPSLTEEQKKK